MCAGHHAASTEPRLQWYAKTAGACSKPFRRQRGPVRAGAVLRDNAPAPQGSTSHFSLARARRRAGGRETALRAAAVAACARIAAAAPGGLTAGQVGAYLLAQAGSAPEDAPVGHVTRDTVAY